MALTDVAICNKALILLGVSTINSFTDDNDRASVCSETYPIILDALLGMTDWRFATGKAQLSQLVSAPVNKWTYAYNLPADYVAGPWAVYNSSAVGAVPVKEWEIFEKKLYADYAAVYIDYRFRPSEANFRPYFVHLLVLALAAAMAPSLTDKDELAVEYNERAFGVPSDNYRGGYYATAAELNALEGGQLAVLQADPAADLISARFS